MDKEWAIKSLAKMKSMKRCEFMMMICSAIMFAGTLRQRRWIEAMAWVASGAAWLLVLQKDRTIIAQHKVLCNQDAILEQIFEKVSENGQDVQTATERDKQG